MHDDIGHYMQRVSDLSEKLRRWKPVIEAAKRYCETGLGSDQLRLAESVDALLAAEGEG